MDIYDGRVLLRPRPLPLNEAALACLEMEIGDNSAVTYTRLQKLCPVFKTIEFEGINNWRGLFALELPMLRDQL